VSHRWLKALVVEQSQRIEELSRRAASGDPVALTLYLKETRGRLRDQIDLRIPRELRGVVDADDVVQEAHVDVFRQIGQFKPREPGSLSRWVATIATHRMHDALRRQRAAKRGGGRPALPATPRSVLDSTVMVLECLAAHPHTPSQSVARREAVQQAQEALAALPGEQREAVTLLYLGGLSAAEAAARMQKTERAIHGLCRRGLQALRDRMALAGDPRTWFA
jgi:RNA polymerase sigma-70 factor (ECF subfamily)